MTGSDFATVMSGYVDTMKAIVQMAVASLVLPIVFLENAVGRKASGKLQELNNWFWVAWALLGLAIALGLIYQSYARKRIADNIDAETVPQSDGPRYLYNVTFALFFDGIGAFIVAIWVATGSMKYSNSIICWVYGIIAILLLACALLFTKFTFKDDQILRTARYVKKKNEIERQQFWDQVKVKTNELL